MPHHWKGRPKQGHLILHQQNSQQKLKETHCWGWAGEKCPLPSSKPQHLPQILGGCVSSHFATAAPTGPRQLRIGLQDNSNFKGSQS